FGKHVELAVARKEFKRSFLINQPNFWTTFLIVADFLNGRPIVPIHVGKTDSEVPGKRVNLNEIHDVSESDLRCLFNDLVRGKLQAGEYSTCTTIDLFVDFRIIKQHGTGKLRCGFRVAGKTSCCSSRLTL